MHTASSSKALFPIPQVHVPGCWLASADEVHRYLHERVHIGMRHTFGTSALGEPLELAEYVKASAPGLMVVGGTHGHEPGGVAAAMNLIHLMESGYDMMGTPRSGLRRLLGRLHLVIVPMLNPDGRRVCPLSFRGLTTDATAVYANGLRTDGSVVPYDADSDTPLYRFDPHECLFIGGQFNGAGIAINRRTSADHVSAVEVAALLAAAQARSPDGIIDLHACGYNFSFQVRSHEAPYWPVMREWQRRARDAFSRKGRPLGDLHGDGDPPTPPPFHFNSSVIHRHARTMWMAFEGRQGYVGRPSFHPVPTVEEIIDDYLTAVGVYAGLCADGTVAAANNEVFG